MQFFKKIPIVVLAISALVLANHAFADTEVLTGADLADGADNTGWTTYGIEFTALQDSSLTSFVYYNQGEADVVELVNASNGDVLDSTPTLSGDDALTVNASWVLTAGDTYYLLGTSDLGKMSTDDLFNSYNNFPDSDSDISVIQGYATVGSTPKTFSTAWFGFGDLTTTTVPDGGSTLAMLATMLGLLAFARRKRGATASV